MDLQKSTAVVLLAPTSGQELALELAPLLPRLSASLLALLSGQVLAALSVLPMVMGSAASLSDLLSASGLAPRSARLLAHELV